MWSKEKQYYPYERVQGFGTMPEMEKVPYMVREYLMDMPTKDYTPEDSNESYRCRLMKYLYYDGDDPLSEPMPTAEQKMKMVFDPDSPDKPPDPTGYRIFTQQLVSQAQTHGVTTLRIYMGRVSPVDAYTAKASVIIECLTNAAYDSNSRTTALSRTYAMAMECLRALNGVNMAAGMVFSFNRYDHPDAGILPMNDETTNVGYRLTMGLAVTGTDEYDQ